MHEPGHVHVLKATKSHESRSSANDLFTPVMNFQKFTGRMIDVPELTQMSGLCSCCFCFFNVCSAALLSFSSFSIMVCNIAKHDGVKKQNKKKKKPNHRNYKPAFLFFNTLLPQISNCRFETRRLYLIYISNLD